MSAGHRPGDDGSDIATGSADSEIATGSADSEIATGSADSEIATGSADGSADGTGTGATDRLGGAPVPFLDLGLQHRAIAADVDTAFARILDRCSFVGGSDVGEFEIAFGAYCGAEHAVGVANGTDAIVMALRALGIGPGDRVAVPANTFIATAEAVALVGGRVVVVDCDPIHQLIDPDSVANAMRSGRLSAVIAVDLYGQRAPIDQLVPLVRNHGAFLIEDAAQAQGATRFGAGIGSGVDVATTSFYPGKNLGAYGDGGAVITDSPALAHHVRLIANHGSRVRYQHEVVGTNSRLDTMQAAVLNAKLAHLDGWNEQRSAAATRYDEMLRDRADLRLPVEMRGNRHVWHVYNVRVHPSWRHRIVDRLNERGIGAAIHYPVAVHRTAAFADRVDIADGGCPAAESSAASTLSLPMFPGITLEQQERVVGTLIAALGELAAEHDVAHDPAKAPTPA
ncbi:MAG: DegT/DnrJ/EryC1/StrS family aminotransferase [Microthrixaceae bacterium]